MLILNVGSYQQTGGVISLYGRGANNAAAIVVHTPLCLFHSCHAFVIFFLSPVFMYYFIGERKHKPYSSYCDWPSLIRSVIVAEICDLSLVGELYFERYHYLAVSPLYISHFSFLMLHFSFYISDFIFLIIYSS